MPQNDPLLDLDRLFQGARDDGLTGDTLDLIVSNLDGPTMTQPLGVGLDRLAASALTLTMNIVDMSGSMQPFAAELCAAYNAHFLDRLRLAPSVDDVLVSTILFDDRVELLHGYVHPADAMPLAPAVYRPRGTTALYDAVAGGVTNMVLYSQQIRQTGIAVRSIVLVYTDGQDNASKQRAADIRRTVEELLDQEIYAFALVGFVPPGQRTLGFKTGAMTDPVAAMAAGLGFRESFNTALDPAGLARLFFLASQSSIQVSRGRPLTGAVLQP